MKNNFNGIKKKKMREKRKICSSAVRCHRSRKMEDETNEDRKTEQRRSEKKREGWGNSR